MFCLFELPVQKLFENWPIFSITGSEPSAKLNTSKIVSYWKITALWRGWEEPASSCSGQCSGSAAIRDYLVSTTGIQNYLFFGSWSSLFLSKHGNFLRKYIHKLANSSQLSINTILEMFINLKFYPHLGHQINKKFDFFSLYILFGDGFKSERGSG
jgi:hypothetical protein